MLPRTIGARLVVVVALAFGVWSMHGLTADTEPTAAAARRIEAAVVTPAPEHSARSHDHGLAHAVGCCLWLVLGGTFARAVLSLRHAASWRRATAHVHGAGRLLAVLIDPRHPPPWRAVPTCFVISLT